MIFKINKTYILCQLIALISFISSIYWINTNKTILTFDSAWYLENSSYFYNSFNQDGLSGVIRYIPSALEGVKAPLISIIPLPFYMILGQSLTSGLMSNAFLIFIYVHYLYLLSCKLFSKSISLLTVIFATTIPLTIGLSHHFFTEFLLSVLVLAFLYHLLIHFERQNIQTTLALGLIFGLGLLTKVNFPIYIIFPTLYILTLSVIDKSFKWKTASLSIISILIGMLIASIWYVPNIKKMWEFAISTSFGDISKIYGSPDVFNINVIVRYVYNVIELAVSLPHFIIIVISFIYALISDHKLFKNTKVMFLISSFVPTLSIFMFSVNKDLRYILPLLAPLSVLTIYFLSQYLSYLTKIIMITLLFIQFFIVSYKPTKKLNEYYLYKFNSTINWQNQDIVSYIDSKLQNHQKDSRYNIVAIEHPYLNANNLSYYSSLIKNSRRPLFSSLGYVETDPNKSIERLEGLNSTFIIFLDTYQDEVKDNPFNKTNDSVYQYITSKSNEFTLSKTLNIDGNTTVKIYERDN